MGLVNYLVNTCDTELKFCKQFLLMPTDHVAWTRESVYARNKEGWPHSEISKYLQTPA
jgi:hypothetical protein